MSKIILKSVGIPLLQTVNTSLPQNEPVQIIISPRIISDVSSSSNEYTGRCKLEICKKSEENSAQKTFYVEVELEGTFLDKAGDSDYETRKDMVMKELLPHINATVRTLSALAKIPSSLIPEEIMAELAD